DASIERHHDAHDGSDPQDVLQLVRKKGTKRFLANGWQAFGPVGEIALVPPVKQELEQRAERYRKRSLVAAYLTSAFPVEDP
ncbi:hypothetical protein NL489_29720, partial [Klebsiella pneumoniae]|nr:hypothetical protein [Klebsiella pneumoniae]